MSFKTTTTVACQRYSLIYHTILVHSPRSEPDDSTREEQQCIALLIKKNSNFFFLLFFLSFISPIIADGPHHYHPAWGLKGSSRISPRFAPYNFFYRDASSALLQLVNQWLNFTYSRSHAFRYERKNTNPTKVRIALTTSVLADVQLTY